MDPDEWTRQEARKTSVDNRCLWCKVRTDDAPDDVDWTPVGEAEQLCSRCLADLREYGRTVHVQIWTTSGLEPAVRRVVREAWSDHVQPELAALYRDDAALFQMPAIRSDAHERDDPGLDASTDDHNDDPNDNDGHE